MRNLGVLVRSMEYGIMKPNLLFFHALSVANLSRSDGINDITDYEGIVNSVIQIGLSPK
jgi:hypothetical protein